MATILALVALRVGIGMHFCVEGINKFVDKKPFVEPFLRNSVGPFAPLFKSFVWDTDGLARLNVDETLGIWDRYREQTISHYGLDDKQSQQAKVILSRRETQLKSHLSDYADDIHEYQKGLKRLRDARQQPARDEVASLRAQLDSLERELAAKRGELLGPIHQMWAGYRNDLIALGQSVQPERAGLTLPKPGRRLLDSETIDIIIRYFDVTVGVLLICGLMTRITALAAAGFLVSIMSSQWPWAPGAVSIWYQFIETLALLVLAATGAGAFAGFDNVLGIERTWERLWAKCCATKQGTSA